MGMPSVIVYGPQGCGKSLNAEKLRRAFGCDHVVDDAEAADVYSGLTGTPAEAVSFKMRSTLYLVHEPPPDSMALLDRRRVLPFAEAMQLADSKASS